MAFNRKKDPRNIEELMISEYKRIIEQNNELQENLRENTESNAAERLALITSFEDKCAAKDAEIAHLKEVLEQKTGVIDLHTPTELVQINMWDTYDLKRYFPSSDDGAKTRCAAVKKLMDITVDKALVREAMKTFRQSASKPCINIEYHTFPHKISIVTAARTQEVYYDPEYSLERFVSVAPNICTEKWIIASTQDIIPVIARLLRSRLAEAYDYLCKAVKEEEEESSNE